MQTSTVSESIPITILTLGIASWTKAITDEYPNFNGCEAKAQMAYYKKEVIGAIKTTILTCRVLWTLRYSMLLAPFSVKMMDPGTKEW
jgi:hypothetical protein